MYKYAVRRLLLAVPVLLLSSLIVFGLMRVMPGDALTARSSGTACVDGLYGFPRALRGLGGGVLEGTTAACP